MFCHLFAVWSWASYLTPQGQQPYLSDKTTDGDQMKFLLWDPEHSYTFMKVFIKLLAFLCYWDSFLHLNKTVSGTSVRVCSAEAKHGSITATGLTQISDRGNCGDPGLACCLK